MPFVENLTAFFADFGVPATLGAATITVIFDAAYADPLGIAGTEPRATCASADVAALVQGSPITIGGKAYTVRDKQPDGTGITVLLLEAA